MEETNFQTWVINDDTNASGWIIEVTTNAEFTLFIVNSSNEPLVEVRYFLEDVHNASDILASDIIGKNLGDTKNWV